VTRFWEVNSAVGGSGTGQQCRCRTVRDDDVAKILHDDRRVTPDPRRGQCLGIAPVTFGRGEQAAPVAEEGDPAVARREQVPHPLGGATGIGGHHRVDVQVHRGPVDAHDRRSGQQLGFEVPLIRARRSDDQAVGAPCGEGLRQLALPVGALVQARREHHHPARHGDVLHGTLQRRGERVRDILQQQPDRGGLAVGPAQAAGPGVRPEPQLVDRSADPHFQRGGHPALRVHHPGHGLEAHPGPSGDIAHGRAPTVGHPTRHALARHSDDPSPAG